MKHKALTFLLAVLMSMVASMASAHDFEVGGIYYNITSSSNLTVAVSYRGSSYDSYYQEYSGRVSIPESVTYNGTTYSVTSIGWSAFSGCSGLTSVTIGNSVTSIGSWAFSGCTGLTSVTIGNSVTEIGYQVFYGCTGLTSVTFNAKNCTTCGSSDYPAFPSTIKTLTIGKEVKKIPSYAFYGCTGLTSVEIPNSVTSIGESVFSGCTGLTSVTIGESVTWIGNFAFWGCRSLTSITIPESVTLIGNDAFRYCYFTYDMFVNNSSLANSDSWGATLCEEETNDGLMLKDKSVVNCRYWATSVTIPNSVISIGGSAFRECSGLTSIEIPNSVTSIGYYAFEGCTGLTSVTIPESVTSIGEWAFYLCSGLTSVAFNAKNCTTCGSSNYPAFPSTIKTLAIGNEVKTIPSYAFKNCTGLLSISIGNGISSIEKGVFPELTLFSLTIGTGVRSIAAFSKNPVKTIWLPNTPPSGYKSVESTVNYVANDQYGALSNVKVYPYLSSMFEADGVKYVPVSPSERTCDAIDCVYDGREEVNVNATVSFKGVAMNVKEVGPYALYRHSAKKMEISNQGTIGDGAFQGCNGLETCTLGDGITAIGQYAFDGCGALQGMTIPKNVATLSSYVFRGCSSLPAIEIPKTVNSVGNYAFKGCKALKTVVMEDEASELQLGSNGSSPLFAGCPLDSVYIGRNITYPTSSGYSPFYRNTSLRSVHITNVETEVSPNEFYGCSALKNVRLGDGITAIGDWAFSGCSSIDYFLFGSSTETIGKEAFSDCTAMRHLISRAPVPPTCDDQALDDINKWNCTLEVPVGSITAYQAAPQWKEFLFMEEGTTAVEGLSSALPQGGEDRGVYDLSGRKVSDNSQVTSHKSQLRKGIYIVNGKKVVVK